MNDLISKEEAISLAYWHGERCTSNNPYPEGVYAVDVDDLEKLSEVAQFTDIHVGDVIQFNENHRWTGCLGFVDKVEKRHDDCRYRIGVPIPEKGTAYIFSMQSKNEFEYVGRAVMLPDLCEED